MNPNRPRPGSSRKEAVLNKINGLSALDQRGHGGGHAFWRADWPVCEAQIREEIGWAQNPVNLEATWSGIACGVYRLEDRLLVIMNIDPMQAGAGANDAAAATCSRLLGEGEHETLSDRG
jgi:hypothetical protein